MADPVRASGIGVGPDDLDRLALRFGLPALERLGGFENILLRSSGCPGRIVRLTHSTRRSREAVEAEVAFMRHLAAAGVPVVEPVPSIAGNLVEELTLDDGEVVVAYCMTEAPGAINEPRDWSDTDIVALGDLLGRAHVAAGSFDPTGPRRPAWTDPVFDPGTSQLDDPEFVSAWSDIRREATAHPAGGNDLLIHQDAHFWNIHIDEAGSLTLFDFDDCGYGTPEHDVAIVLFYWLFVAWPEPIIEAKRFLERLQGGYTRHATLAADWPEGIDRILKVRESDIYLLLELEGDSSDLAWMHDRRRRVLERVPLLGVPLVDIL